MGLKDFIREGRIQFQMVINTESRQSQVFASLHDRVALETEEQTVERERNERDVLDVAVGNYACLHTIGAIACTLSHLLVFSFPRFLAGMIPELR